MSSLKNEKDASCKDISDHDNESSMLKEKSQDLRNMIKATKVKSWAWDVSN